jgi:3-oxoacyl-[acyl-carrier protein] reductase
MTAAVTRKTVIITGAGKGIGRAIALKLALLPYNLVLNYARDETSAQETQRLCERFTSHVRLVQADVARRTEVNQLIDGAYETFGSVDVLINNAGINIDRPMHDLTDDDWDRVVDTNMKGVFLCSQRASSYMLRQAQGGIILNLGATTAIRGRANGLNYCASKAGVLVMTKCMALELAPSIRVNCLIPGFTSTTEVEHRFGLTDPETLQAVEQRIPLHRIAAPEEVADIATFLLSDEARHITGQKFIIDGGEYMF